MVLNGTQLAALDHFKELARSVKKKMEAGEEIVKRAGKCLRRFCREILGDAIFTEENRVMGNYKKVGYCLS